MTDEATTRISVRGEARLTVPPDLLVLSCSMALTRPTKADALAASAGVLDAVTADLRSLGGVALGADTVDAALTWSAHAARTWEDRDVEWPVSREGVREASRPRVFVSSVSLSIVLRSLEERRRLASHLARHAELNIEAVHWEVEPTNAGWAEVRAAAIRAAIAKGQSYALALGGRLERVEHVADAGLLGAAESAGWVAHAESGAFAAAGRHGERSDTPSLDPVPQELVAMIEARFVASIAQLGG